MAGHGAQKSLQTIEHQREALIFGMEDLQRCGGEIKEAVEALERACEALQGEESSWGASVDREGLYIHFTLSYSHTLD